MTIIVIVIHILVNKMDDLRVEEFYPVREEQCRAMKGGQTTQKAKLYLGGFWTSQPEQFLTPSL